MGAIKQGEVVDVTALVANPEADGVVELKPEAQQCVECGKTVRFLFPDHKCQRHSLFRPSIKEGQRRANEMIQRNQERYARLHFAGAVVAAAKGDTRPAEWALTHGRSVEPVSNKSDNGPAVVVVVGGAQLPGLPPVK